MIQAIEQDLCPGLTFCDFFIYLNKMYHSIFKTLLFAAALLLFVPSARTEEKPFLIFAAASLKDALEPIARDFEKETGRKVTLSFAGSSMLARQIAAGAPADIFISADLDWAAWLKVQNQIVPETQRIIARNRLALVAPSKSPFQEGGLLVETLVSWRDTDKSRLAVADPDHVPAGRYARAALKSLKSDIGSYDTFKVRFAIGGNVRLAALLVARGEVSLGIVYHSDAVTNPGLKLIGLFADGSHPDIAYPAVRLTRGRPEADVFLDYLLGEKARRHMADAGLTSHHGGL